MAKATASTIKQLKSDISGGEFKPLYVFYGDEKYLLEYYVNTMKKKLIAEGSEDFNYFVFEASTLDYEQLTDAVESLPVFSNNKFVVVEDLDLGKLKEDAKEVIEAIIEDIPEGCCILFIYDTIEYKMDEWTKLFKQISKVGRIVEFGKQASGELIPWIKRHFKAHGKVIDTAEAEHMIFICGSLMNSLQLEVEKVAAYAKGNKITKSDIDAVCVPVVDAVVFDLADAVVDKRYNEAFMLLDNLATMKVEPIVLLALLGRQLRQLYCIKQLPEDRAADLLKESFGVYNSYVRKKLISSARRLPITWFAEALKLCADCDLEMKSTGADNHDVFELLLLRLNNIQVEEYAKSKRSYNS